MRELYCRFALLLQTILMAFGLVLFVLAHPKTVQLVAKKGLENTGVSFGSIEGSLLFGFTLYDIRYKKAVNIGRLDIGYSLAELISYSPTLRKIAAEDVDIYPDRFGKKSSESKRGLQIPLVLRISDVVIKRGRVHTKQKAEFDLDAKEIRVATKDIAVRRFEISANTQLANAELEGYFKNMALHARGNVTPSHIYIERAEKYIKNMPRNFPITLYADEKEALIETSAESVIKISEGNVSVEDLEVAISYPFKENFFKVKASYGLSSPIVDIKVRQSAFVTPFLAYTTKIEAKVERSALKLPFENFRTDAAGDTSVFMADTYAGPFVLGIYSSDLENFAIRLSGKRHPITYISHLPPLFSHQYVAVDINATARFERGPKINGVMKLDGNYTTVKSYFELEKRSLLAKSVVAPKEKKGGIWESIPKQMRKSILTFIYISKEQKIFNLNAKKAAATLFLHKNRIEGWANIGSLMLDANGDIHRDGSMQIVFDTNIDSLHALFQEFGIKTDPMVDAQIKNRFDLTIADTFSLRYKTEVPWYIIKPDSQRIFYGFDSELEGSLKDNIITIDRYSIAYKERRFIQTRPSFISFEENGTLRIEKLSLLDTLEAKGYFVPSRREGEISLYGKKTHYSGPEGDITADIDLNVSISSKKLYAEGEIRIDDALIRYRPKKEYEVEDEDIIIIQDIKEPSHTKRGLNIHIVSNSPLRYEIDEVKARFIPDITLWKERGRPMEILGMVKILDGTIDAADKHFIIMPSEIYFGGAHPINPYLNLHIDYELDLYRFSIYVSHTLAKPLFLFSSQPPMNQNDIMSYILFGAPAEEAFRASGEPSASIATMLLGLGLKNAIGSATGIRFDTLNILSSETGGFGIEVGKRIGKRLRIIYRSDTVSSFIIQYKASRNIRIDVDVKDTGQGINILYVKDIKRIGL